MTRLQAQRVVFKAKDELLKRRIVALDGSGNSAVESLLILASEAARGELEIIDKQPPLGIGQVHLKHYPADVY